MKSVTTFASVIALTLASAAFAQNDTTQTQGQNQAQQDNVKVTIIRGDSKTTTEAADEQSDTQMQAAQMPEADTAYTNRASNLLGLDVNNAQDEKIGKIDDLLIAGDGRIAHVVISVGGFLGIGDKLVTVPYDELQVNAVDDDLRVVYNASKEELEAQTAFDYRDMEHDFAALSAEAKEKWNDTKEATKRAAHNVKETSKEAWDKTKEATKQAVSKTKQAAQEMVSDTEQALDEGAQEVEQQTQVAMAKSEQAVEQGARKAGQAADQMGDRIDLTTWDQAELYGGWRASDLIGLEVRGSHGDELGEIENIHVGEDGKIKRIVVEAGGFLDIGDTHFGVSWDQVTVGPNMEYVQVPIDEESYDSFSLFNDDENVATGPRAWRATQFMGDMVSLAEGERYGIVDDLIFDRDGSIKAIVVNPAVGYGPGGYYAYPYYGYYDRRNPETNMYQVPYSRSEIENLAPFDYAKLRRDAF